MTTNFNFRNYVLKIADNGFVALRDSKNNSIHLSIIDCQVDFVKAIARDAAKLGGAKGAALLTMTFKKTFTAA